MRHYSIKLTAFFSAACVAVAAFGITGTTAGPATKPTAAEATSLSGTALAIRAQQSFNRGEYTLALPLLQKVIAENKASGDTSKVGSLEERVRVCEKALAAVKLQAGKQPAGQTTAAAARADATPEARKPHPVLKAGEVFDTSIKNLGNFEYDQEKGGNVPADVVKLNGSTVRLQGYMIPMDQAENITQFALVPSLFSCCIGQPPQIQHTIVVNCPKGKAVGYTADEISVEGKLNVQEKKDDGYIISLFEVEVSSIKLAPKGQ